MQNGRTDPVWGRRKAALKKRCSILLAQKEQGFARRSKWCLVHNGTECAKTLLEGEVRVCLTCSEKPVELLLK